MDRLLVSTLLIATFATVTSGLAQGNAPMRDKIREYSLEHPQPESRTRWRIPEAYLSRQPFNWQSVAEPTKQTIVFDAALPDLRPWWTSGLRLSRDDDAKLMINISVSASYDFSMEKRIIPRLLQPEFEVIGEHPGGFVKYRKVRKDEQGKVVFVSDPWFYLIPKEQIAAPTIYFSCVRRCSAHADFSERVVMQYGFDLALVGDWRGIDRKVRDLLGTFIVP